MLESILLRHLLWLSLCSVCIFAEPGRRSAFVTTHVALGGRRGSIFGPRNSHVLGGEGELARVLAATRGRWDVLECFGTLLRACADPRGSGRREWLIPCSQLSRAAPSAGGARRRRPGGSGGAGPPPAAGGSPRRLSSRRLMAEPGAFRAAVRAGAQCLCGAAAAAAAASARDARRRSCRVVAAPRQPAVRRDGRYWRADARLGASPSCWLPTAAAATTTTARSFAAAAARWLAALLSLATCRGGSRGGVVR